jgi:transketolase
MELTMREKVREPAGEPVSMRRVYGQALVELGGRYEDMVVLSADVSSSDHSSMFAEAFPERFFNVGITEQALVDVAAGLAYNGKTAIANTFAFLLASRALEQVRTHLCFGEANVKLAGAYAGLSDSYDGPTHQSIADLAVMRCLPRMTVVVPADPRGLRELLPQIVSRPGPVYFRLCRNELPEIFTEDYAPRIGEAVLLREGNDATIICCGVMVARSLRAAADLAREGIEARVVEMHTLKPLDEGMIRRCADETGAIVTVEEHSVLGGLGGAVAETLAAGRPVPLQRVGLRDCFAETGGYQELLDRYGLGVNNVAEAVQKVLSRKNNLPRAKEGTA